MPKDNKVRMPSSMAGITQYFDESTSKIKLSPKQVMILICTVAIIIIMIHLLVPVVVPQ